MAFERIEKLKDEYTDKYVVVVDKGRPELSRFGGFVGQVITVNMNGRALVEFDRFNNTGRFDIELDYLKVVEKPEPAKPAAKKPPAKRPAKPPVKTEGAELSPLEKARMQGSAKAGGDKGTSTAEILAAARRPKSGAASGSPKSLAKPSPPKERGKMSTADILAAARGDSGAKPKAESPASKTDPSSKPDEPSQQTATAQSLEGSRRPKRSDEAKPPSPATPAKKDRSKMSVAEMIAAARAEKTGAAPQPKASEEAVIESDEAKPASPAKPAKKDRSKMSVAEMIAAARAEKTGAAPQPKASEEASEEAVVEEESPQPKSDETAGQEAPLAAESAPQAPDASALEKPTTTEEIIAYCRRLDGK